MARLKEMYVKEVAPALMKKFSYKSTMQIPKLDKIVVNVGASGGDHRSKAPCLPRKKVCCELQAQRGHGHRRKGYAQRRENV